MKSLAVAAVAFAAGVFALVGDAHAHQGWVKYDRSKSYVDEQGYTHLYFYNSHPDRAMPVVVRTPEGNLLGPRGGNPIPPRTAKYVDAGRDLPTGWKFEYTDEPEDF